MPTNGYARVSTEEQITRRQFDELTAAGCKGSREGRWCRAHSVQLPAPTPVADALSCCPELLRFCCRIRAAASS